MEELLKQHYAHIFEPELLKEIAEVGVLREVTEGEKLMEIGQYMTAMPLLISGAIKILREDSQLLRFFPQYQMVYSSSFSFHRDITDGEKYLILFRLYPFPSGQ